MAAGLGITGAALPGVTGAATGAGRGGAAGGGFTTAGGGIAAAGGAAAAAGGLGGKDTTSVSVGIDPGGGRPVLMQRPRAA
jgi:hypothetical protein